MAGSVPEIREIIDEDTLKRILVSYTEATGIHAQIVDLHGKPLLQGKTLSQWTQFCRLVRAGKEGSNKCEESYVRAGKYSAKFGGPYIFCCPAGLVSWAAPLMAGENQVGSIICGQVLMWEPEDFFWEELHEVANKFAIEPARLQSAAEDLEVISTVRVQAAADLLFTVADNIMRTGFTVLEHRRAVARQQANLAHEILKQKTLRTGPAEDSSRYSLEKESEVLARVRLRDAEGATKAMGSLLSSVVQSDWKDPRLLKARLKELLALLSRTAIEAGATREQTFQIACAHMEKLDGLQLPEDMCYLADAALTEYLDCLIDRQTSRCARAVTQAQNYIHQNFSTIKSVKEVADDVRLTPDYLARLFKRELGVSPVEYLTRVRIEEAKRLLLRTRWNMTELALKVGYSDPSYLIKVFKRVQKVCPGYYRDHAVFEKTPPRHVIRPRK